MKIILLTIAFIFIFWAIFFEIILVLGGSNKKQAIYQRDQLVTSKNIVERVLSLIFYFAFDKRVFIGVIGFICFVVGIIL